MPILNIKSLPQSCRSKVEQATAKLTQVIADKYQCSQKQVWVTWDFLGEGLYFEGEVSEITQPQLTHPPICELICFEGKSEKQIEELLLAAAASLSSSLSIPNNIFMYYKELKSGQVISGNGVIRK